MVAATRSTLAIGVPAPCPRHPKTAAGARWEGASGPIHDGKRVIDELTLTLADTLVLDLRRSCLHKIRRPDPDGSDTKNARRARFRVPCAMRLT
jgi:hypothetical protein